MAKHRRGRSNASAVGDRLPLSFSEVYLLTAESQGQLAVGGLTLVVDHDGLSVVAPHGSTAAALAWSELTVLRTEGRTTAPGGEEAVFLEASRGERTHRFVVPTDDASSLESTIAAITGVPGPEPSRRARRRAVSPVPGSGTHPGRPPVGAKHALCCENHWTGPPGWGSGRLVA